MESVDDIENIPEGAEEILNQKVDSVRIDVTAALKIISHCGESVPGLVTGQLLGLDVDGVLEITNCFPSTADRPVDDNDEYQMTVMRCFRDVNIDHNAVGWYQSAYMGSFLSQSLIETQYNYQQSVPQSVMLIYDPFNVAQGIPILAYRLSEKFMDLFQHKKFNIESIKESQLCSNDILEQLPVTIFSSPLQNAFMTDLSHSITKNNCFKWKHMKHVEKSLDLLSECVDAHGQEIYRWNRYQQNIARQQQTIQHHLYKRKMENQRRVAAGQEPLPDEDISALFKPFNEPSQLEILLLSKQASNFCEQLTQSTCADLVKMTL